MTSTTTGTTGTTGTTNSTTPSMDDLRTKQQAVWSSGDYNRIAALTVPVNEMVVAAAAVRPGERVLDIATGTGHAALAAARQGGDVTGIDYVPALLEIARDRAAAEHVEVEFTESAAEHLPFDDASFDVVVSAIGVMFAADHQAAADEIARVSRPGGRVALASWTAEGFVGGILGTVGRHVSPPPGAQPAVRWGDEAIVAGLLGDRVTDLASTTHVVPVRFADAAAFADLFLTYYGPTYSAAAKLDDAGRSALRADLVELASSSAVSTDGDAIHLEWQYRVVTATRA
ncbi:class I SAM-dependent methyltransferase [Nocardioides sp. SYSU D00038]|uniref:class I SAM-dependent methyltransferase n=1 Tax=Nocardioides sp. SYSU D00038 TaxID=2812554 RepID=UPI001967E58B|nr:methyltransferase domain-containing protein [Nocardioides sp. SYSU D00038]